MSHDRARPRGRADASAGHAAPHARETGTAGPGHAGPSYAAGPIVGLGSGAQRKARVGQSGDAYERQADAVASRVATGGTLGPSPAQGLAPGAVGRAEADAGKKPDEKKPEASVQKADAGKKPDEKKPEASVQKADAGKKPDEKKPEASVQKADAGKKPDEKKPEASVQKADAGKKPDEKKPEASVQKADAGKKPEEKKPEASVQKADAGKKPEDEAPGAGQADEQLGPEQPIQRADERAAPGSSAGGPQVATPTTAPPERQQGGTKAPGEGAGKGAGLDDIAQQAIASAGPGRALDRDTRSTLEERMHADLRDVRIHDDSSAQQAASQLNARAFTHGRDIWLGPGQSDTDVELIAHEATHVLQQSGGIDIQRSAVQRSAAASAVASEQPAVSLATVEPTEAVSDDAHTRSPDTDSGDVADGGSEGAADAGDAGAAPPGVPSVQLDAAPTGTASELEISELKVPKFKLQDSKTDGTGVRIKAGANARPPSSEDQTKKWNDEVEASVEKNLPSKLKSKIANQQNPGQDKPYFLKIGKTGRFVIGTDKDLKKQFVRPNWNEDGSRQHMFQVDHKKEIQLGGPNEFPNLWLLDAASNQASGRNVKSELRPKIEAAIEKENKKPPDKRMWKKKPSVTTARSKYDIVIKKLVPGLEPDVSKATWTHDDIKAVDKAIKSLEPATDDDIKKLTGTGNDLVIFLTPGGSKPRRFPNKKGEEYKPPNDDWIRGVKITSVSYTSGKGGKLGGELVRKDRKDTSQTNKKRVDWVLSEAAPNVTVIDPGSLSKSLQYDELESFSPVTYQTVTLDETKGLQARGKLTPTVNIFKGGLRLDVVRDGPDLGLSATFTKDDFSFPGPIQITEAALSVEVFASKVDLNGDLFIEIPKLVRGQTTGSGSTTGEWSIGGKLEPISDTFDEAELSLRYTHFPDGKSKLSGSGKLSIKKGKVKGVESASIQASFDDGVIKAEGMVKPSIPGVEQASLTVAYSEKEGLAIGGELQLKKDIPGIAGGSVKVDVTQKPGEERYRVKAVGQATPKIPGVSSSLNVLYDDGLFDANATASYEKGMLKGSLTVGATNRPVGPDGKPAEGVGGDAVTDKIIVYGGGSLTLRLSPWLQGTAGVMLKPNGEIEVRGEIGLPASIDLLPEKAFTKNLFKVGVDIPIVGVSVAGQRIGIFANITGGADLSAGIGPVQLNQLSLAVTYNPDHEDQTLVTGKANLHVGAHAGIRLFVRGGIGVGIPIVSAQAGLEIGAELGLAGALDAGVEVNWSPAKGIVLDAKGSLFVEPRLKVDLTGFVLVEADLLLTSITLYEQKWKLGGFEVGSGLRLGVTFPIHYEEGKPFDISLSDLQFQVPDINPMDVLTNIIKQIA